MMRLFLQGRVADTATNPSWCKSFWRIHFNRRSSPLHDNFDRELNFAMSFFALAGSRVPARGAGKMTRK